MVVKKKIMFHELIIFILLLSAFWSAYRTIRQPYWHSFHQAKWDSHKKLAGKRSEEIEWIELETKFLILFFLFDYMHHVIAIVVDVRSVRQFLFGLHFKNAAHVMLAKWNAFKLTILLNVQLICLTEFIEDEKKHWMPFQVLFFSSVTFHMQFFCCTVDVKERKERKKENPTLNCLLCAWGQNGQFKLVSGQFSSCESFKWTTS